MSYDPTVSLVIAGVLLLLAFVFLVPLYRASFGRDYQPTATIRKKVFTYLLLTLLFFILSCATVIFVIVMSGIN